MKRSTKLLLTIWPALFIGKNIFAETAQDYLQKKAESVEVIDTPAAAAPKAKPAEVKTAEQSPGKKIDRRERRKQRAAARRAAAPVYEQVPAPNQAMPSPAPTPMPKAEPDRNPAQTCQ